MQVPHDTLALIHLLLINTFDIDVPALCKSDGQCASSTGLYWRTVQIDQHIYNQL